MRFPKFQGPTTMGSWRKSAGVEEGLHGKYNIPVLGYKTGITLTLLVRRDRCNPKTLTHAPTTQVS